MAKFYEYPDDVYIPDYILRLNDRDYHLLIYHPRAFLLLSYLRLLCNIHGHNPVTLRNHSISEVGSSSLLTKEQLLPTLKKLVRFGFISYEKHSMRGCGYFVNLLDQEHLNE